MPKSKTPNEFASESNTKEPSNIDLKGDLNGDLSGRVILISGASSGIGRGTALDLAARGAWVFAGVRNPEACPTPSQGRLQPVHLDVTDEASVHEAVATVLREAGRLDVLINNAGIAVGGPAEALSLSDYRAQFDVNVFGMIALTKAAIPALRSSRGRIVMVSSVNGRLATPYLSAYAASKFALEGFSDALRFEMSEFGVHVSLIEPGPIQTPIWEKSTERGNDLESTLSESLRALYGESLKRLRRAVKNSEKNARPVEDVLKAMRHAVGAARPQERYVIGRDNQIFLTLADILPTRWMDALIRHELKKESGQMR